MRHNILFSSACPCTTCKNTLFFVADAVHLSHQLFCFFHNRMFSHLTDQRLNFDRASIDIGRLLAV